MLLALFLLAFPCEAFRTQSVAIKGQLFCGNVPAADTLVQLYDQDDGPDPDDMLDKAYTSANGSFYLSGDTVELTNIDPELRVYHTCAMHLPICKREWIIGIPDKYIWSGNKPKSAMDLGRVNLEVELEDEDRHDCIH